MELEKYGVTLSALFLDIAPNLSSSNQQGADAREREVTEDVGVDSMFGVTQRERWMRRQQLTKRAGQQRRASLFTNSSMVSIVHSTAWKEGVDGDIAPYVKRCVNIILYHLCALIAVIHLASTPIIHVYKSDKHHKYT